MKEFQISERLKIMRDEALRHFEIINGPSSVHKIHAHIGRNNNTFGNGISALVNSKILFICNIAITLLGRKLSLANTY
ncbi:hypothetical protein UA38_03870 [Photobacterium kishitanii]|uniref:Uncharacterized protein n=1 Tax=Photobacterium kishitanii TaxID=318456 RepID=A0AAX0YW52_9GAMM|nr:hypothetical protein [Photobacterium kishitanii]KJG58896.1 hypothetical protein UA38_03870 [Photobacterium kishitanii]KJG62175.1 hypothetical protein UA42_07275 [Photobacterium kishitanii]KJG67097.1 hypothetical protein UA40_03870 [Photobacterium kishitanii]KJG70659.1 hypothetical protein UA41_05520 [Photobacterium kishitanii]PSX20923.1 hypothetical protein C0W70_01425 [Photobacterium kishitanii]